MGKGGDARSAPEDVAGVARRDAFFFSDEPEPHAARKVEILKAHPEIKSLMRPEPLTKYTVAATVALQVYCAWVSLEWSWAPYMALVYVVGATANHSLFLAIHELSHNLGSKGVPALGLNMTNANRVISFLANLPIGIAYCINFRPYHMEHHRCQGHEGIDTDIPTKLECQIVTDMSQSYVAHTLKKAIFMFNQIFFYALRPCIMKPDMIVYDRWLAANWVVQLAFDAAIVYAMGVNGMLYFLLSTFFAGSIHPTAGHFLAEHYVVDGRTETYSYYGWLNIFAYNVGYHNEHHDFPNIPWTRLPTVRKIAPEFYDDLPQCSSWVGIIFTYIFDDTVGPYSRMKRDGAKTK